MPRSPLSRDTDTVRLLDDLVFGSRVTQPVVTGQGTAAVVAAQSGTLFICLVDAVITLPTSAVDLKGVYYEFECGAVSAGTGLSISPAALDGLTGNGFTEAVNKDAINSGATDVLGDRIRVRCTGQTGVKAWVIEDRRGIWAREA